MSAIRNGSHPRHGLSSSRASSLVWVHATLDPLASATEMLQAATIHRNIEDYLRYLYHQIRSREYDRLANLAVLKLFALFICTKAVH